MLTFQLLRRDHDRSTFSCSEASLAAYVRQQALQDAKRGIAACYVLCDDQSPAIIGYYTLSAHSLRLTSLRPEEVRKLPRYPYIPVGLLGRMAVDDHWRGHGYGADLLANAIKRLERSEIALYALIVDAIHETAAAFYQHFGFQRTTDDPLRLYLPLRWSGSITTAEPAKP